MKINRIILVCLLVAGFLVSGFSQAADNAVTIKKLELNIWPEYDQPQTLVIFPNHPVFRYPSPGTDQSANSPRCRLSLQRCHQGPGRPGL